MRGLGEGILAGGLIGFQALEGQFALPVLAFQGGPKYS